MTTPLSPRRTILLSALFACLLILLCGGIGVVIISDPDLHKAFILPEIALEIQQVYSGQVDWNKMVDAARQSMFDDLDRFSSYIDPRQFSQMDEELTGGYSGIGISVVKNEQGLLVMSVRESGPAARGGLLIGDIISAVDSVPIAQMEIDQASSKLRGPTGSSSVLTVLRPSTQDTLNLRVVRDRISFEHIPFAGYTPDSVIYVRLLDFEAGASIDLQRSLDSLLHQSGIKPRGVILDLKGNPGGLFSEAYQTASLFLNKGQFIVGTQARSRWNQEEHWAMGHDITGGLPMVVLVDRGTASAAEIVSGALKQNNRARLVGDTTFGKGLVQGFTRFPDGSGLRLTISRYYLEGNVFLNRFDSTLSDTGNGLVPDYHLAAPERDHFIANLESSLLLSEFAQQYEDQIIEGPPRLGPDTTWAAHFAVFARSRNFAYRSDRTIAAERFLKTATDNSRTPEVLALANRVIELSRHEDQMQFTRFRDYIEMRLRQLAYERKYGSHRAYQDVIIRERPDIRAAEQILSGVRQS